MQKKKSTPLWPHLTPRDHRLNKPGSTLIDDAKVLSLWQFGF